MVYHVLRSVAPVLVALVVAPTTAQPSTRLNEVKLNYYRYPGAPGWCEHDCDGTGPCCTVGLPDQ